MILRPVLAAFVALSSMLFMPPTSAADVCPGPADVYYVNGVKNTYKQASKAADALADAISAALPGCPAPNILLAYNPTSGLPLVGGLVDINEARKQVFDGIGADDPVLRDHVFDNYLPSIRSNRKVIVVAHSQGNLYANKAFERLVDERVNVSAFFAIVAVASPATYIAGYPGECRFDNCPAVTVTEDAYATVFQAWAAVPAFYSNSVVCTRLPLPGSSLCHDFVKWYLAGASSTAAITGHVISELPPPPTTATINVVSNVSKSWTLEPEGLMGSGIFGSHTVTPSPFGTFYTLTPAMLLGYTVTVTNSDGGGADLVLIPGDTKSFRITYFEAPPPLPAAVDDPNYKVTQGSSLIVLAPGVLGNDTIAAGTNPRVEFLPTPSPGTFSPVGVSGGFTYVPNPTFIGSVLVNYVVHTDLGDSNVATVTIQIEPPPMDAFTWSERVPLTNPSARRSHAMAYDRVRREVVLFGGAGNPDRLDDTWVWDGSDWKLKNPAQRPPRRGAHAMTFDASRGEVILFGGVGDGNLFLRDTWVWDGSEWAQKITTRAPVGSSNPRMVYDVIRGEVLLFGGFNGIRFNETWAWDGTDWTQRMPEHNPPGRSIHAMVYDEARGEVLLFGGFNGVSSVDDTWVWNRVDWSQVAATASPSARRGHAMAYDPDRGLPFLFGGFSDPSTWHNDTWAWDGATWAQLNFAESPAANSDPVMVYDAARKQVVLFGGLGSNSNLLSQTWVLGTASAVPAVVLQPGPAQSKDIWTTSVFSYAPAGGGPGGGLDDASLRVGGWGDIYHSLLQFDISALPGNVTSATLQIFCYGHQNGTPTPMFVDRITESWDWRTQGTGSDRLRLWWVDRPAAVQWSAGEIPNPTAGQWYSIDITALYRAWKAGTLPNYGLQLRPVNTNNNFNLFYSSDYLGDPSLRPKLLIRP